MAPRSEFRVQDAYPYDQRSPARWIFSHAWRYKGFVLGGMLLYLIAHASYSGARVVVGQAAEVLMASSQNGALLRAGLSILGLLFLDGLAVLLASYSFEVIGNRVARDAREELYASLLGKSQTFHDRQRVGDIMARATDDVQQLSAMIIPGVSLTFDSMLGLVVPLIYIAFINPTMLLVPLIFVACYFIALRDYMRQLQPVSQQAAHAVWGDERRPGRDHLRHRGRQGQRAGSIRALQVSQQRAPVP